ncbi:MAG: OmpA family protein [Planctomycetota bacterium]
MKFHQWALMALLCVTTAGCVSRAAYTEKIDELRQAKAQLRSVSDLAQQYGAQVGELEAAKNSTDAQNALLRSNNDEYSRKLEELTRRLEEAAEANPLPGGVEGFNSGDGSYTYRVTGDFLFDAGKAELKPSGKKTISEMAAILSQNDYKIEVAGHTDTDPVAKSIKNWPRGNIELGAQRAIAVWEALKKAGIPESRMRVSSFGEYAPVRPGDKDANRRVELRLLLEEPSAQS